MSVTAKILSQTVSGISKANPSMTEVKDRATEIVNDSGKVQGEDYDAISVAYRVADSGNLGNGGGWASVNGLFSWVSYPHRRK